ncbi:C40 family peptidase [Streptomyces fenghuangensis]
MKKTAAVVGAVAVGPMFLLAPAVVAGAHDARAVCADGAQAVDAVAVARQVEEILNGGDGGSVSVPGLEAPKEQVRNARIIQATGVAMGVPPRGQVVALATALQESSIRNLAYGDRDSLGLFQQRPSQGWGTAEQVRDPVHASRRFYQVLLEVDGWESMTVTQAAQAVQRSAYPDAYAKWEPLATALQRAIARTLPQDGAGGSGAGRSVAASGCSDEEIAGAGPIPEGKTPAGYEIPRDAPRPVRTAIRWALGQLGTPYQWGGTCTDPRGPDPMGRCDCSSLMQMAYKAGGVTLSRTTYTQVKEGRAVGVGGIRPGDLVFTRGTPARPEHVGMYIGSGYIVNAPRTGEVVRVEPLADWKPQILAVRRVV